MKIVLTALVLLIGADGQPATRNFEAEISSLEECLEAAKTFLNVKPADIGAIGLAAGCSIEEAEEQGSAQ